MSFAVQNQVPATKWRTWLLAGWHSSSNRRFAPYQEVSRADERIAVRRQPDESIPGIGKLSSCSRIYFRPSVTSASPRDCGAAPLAVPVHLAQQRIGACAPCTGRTCPPIRPGQPSSGLLEAQIWLRPMRESSRGKSVARGNIVSREGEISPSDN